MATSFASEIRSAARGLVRAPTVTLSAILCIAVALGATAAIWSAIDRALLQPLPFREPERLVTVFRTTPHFDTGPFSAPNYLDLARERTPLEALAAATPRSVLLSLTEGAERVSGYRVTGNFFQLLGAPASAGRLLLPSDDQPGENPVVVVSDEFWRAKLGADPSVVGRSLTLDGRAHTVVGVAPPRFAVPHGGSVLRGTPAPAEGPAADAAPGGATEPPTPVEPAEVGDGEAG